METQGPAISSCVPLLPLWMVTGIVRPHACWIINGSREPQWPSPSWICCMWISTQFWNIRWFFGFRRERISSIESWRTFTSYALRSASDKLCNQQQLKCNNVNCKLGNYMYINHIIEQWKCTSSTTIKLITHHLRKENVFTETSRSRSHYNIFYVHTWTDGKQ